jgi:hypothetical protein
MKQRIIRLQMERNPEWEGLNALPFSLFIKPPSSPALLPKREKGEKENYDD